MDSLASLFRGRQVSTASSEKRTTVKVRERESRRRGVYAAELKIKEKWRKRRNRGIAELRESDAYKRLAVYDVEQCESYVSQFRELLERAGNAEIESVRAFARAYPASVPASTNSMVSTPQVGLRRIAPKPVVLVRKDVPAPPLAIASFRDHGLRSSLKSDGRCPGTLQHI
jgi:hypothetical protein